MPDSYWDVAPSSSGDGSPCGTGGRAKFSTPTTPPDFFVGRATQLLLAARKAPRMGEPVPLRGDVRHRLERTNGVKYLIYGRAMQADRAVASR